MSVPLVSRREYRGSSAPVRLDGAVSKTGLQCVELSRGIR
jgi:hypothetical protein